MSDNTTAIEGGNTAEDIPFTGVTPRQLPKDDPLGRVSHEMMTSKVDEDRPPWFSMTTEKISIIIHSIHVDIVALKLYKEKILPFINWKSIAQNLKRNGRSSAAKELVEFLYRDPDISHHTTFYRILEETGHQGLVQFLRNRTAEQEDPIHLAKATVRFQISPKGANYYFAEENITVVVPPNSIDPSIAPRMASIVPKDSKTQFTPDAVSKLYMFYPNDLSTKNRMMIAIPLNAAHTYDYNNMALMYREGNQSAFVDVEAMEHPKPVWRFRGNTCYLFLNHFCEMYVRKVGTSEEQTYIPLECFLFYKYTSASKVLELKTTFACYAEKSTCSMKNVIEEK